MIDVNNNTRPLEDITKFPGWIGQVTSKKEIDPLLAQKVADTYALSVIGNKFYLSYITPDNKINHYWLRASEGNLWEHRNYSITVGNDLLDFIKKAMKCEGNRKPIPVSFVQPTV